MFDTARADSFEPYGAPSGASPAFAQLAARGSSAQTVYSTANWTLPSHTSIFTGLLPRTAGLAQRVRPIDTITSWRDRLLPEVFRRAGYSTFGVSANPWISKAHGFDTGFETFRLVGSGRAAWRPGMKSAAKWWLSTVRAKADDGLANVEQVVREAIGGRTTKPFFGFVNLMECHSPYMPPRPYNDLGVPQRVAAARDIRRFQTERGFYEVTVGDVDLPDDSVRRMRHLYAQSIRMMDDWLARMLAMLDSAGILDETLVVVTSDHGENLGESHTLGHVISMSDRLIRVPLVAAGANGLDTSGALSQVDLAALIAEAAGLTDAPWQRRADRDVTISQDDGLMTMQDAAARALMDLWKLPAHIESLVRTPRDCAVRGSLKLVRVGADVTLIDLASDPSEQRNVAAEHPDVVAELTRVLDDASRYDAPVGGAPAAAPELDQSEADELEERMRLLGYL